MKLKRLGSALATVVLSFSSLAVLPMGVAHAASTDTWTGTAGDGKFSTAANWSAGVAPVSGDTLVFDGTSLTGWVDVNDDIANLSIAGITLQGTNSNFYGLNISGSALTLAGNISNTTGANTELAFKNNVVLGSDVTIASGAGLTGFDGVVSGTGNIISSSGYLFLAGANTFTGTITVNAGSLAVSGASSLGNAANKAVVNDGADISIGSCGGTGFTLPNDITLTGASSQPTGTYPSPKLYLVGGVCAGSGGASSSSSYDETYTQVPTGTQVYTLSGHIALGSNVVFGAMAKTTTITGPLSGNFKFTLPNNWGGSLVVASSANTSAMPNGTYKVSPIVKTLSDDQSAHSVLLDGSNVTVTIDGKRGTTEVDNSATLKGIGTVGKLTVLGGIVAPGHSPGCMNTGNLSLNGTYQVELGGTTPCSGYDQLKVTGTVDVSNGVLSTSLYGKFSPAKGQKYTIISNDGKDAVTGTFQKLKEGATFKVGSAALQISYKGGDGNDVVLSVVSAPDTGFAMASSNPTTTLAVTAVLGLGILGMSRRLARR